MPVTGSRSTAFCGQTLWHSGSFSHCMHITGMKASRPPVFRRNTRSQLSPVRGVAAGCGGGTLFSTAQATMQAPQPLQRSRSMSIA